MDIRDAQLNRKRKSRLSEQVWVSNSYQSLHPHFPFAAIFSWQGPALLIFMWSVFSHLIRNCTVYLSRGERQLSPGNFCFRAGFVCLFTLGPAHLTAIQDCPSPVWLEPKGISALSRWATGTLQGCCCLCRRLSIPGQKKNSMQDVPCC